MGNCTCYVDPTSHCGAAMITLLTILSCKTDENTIVVDCDPNVVTYESVGQPFLRNYCTGCHSSHLTLDQRYGAPEHVNLETFDEATQWSTRSYVRATIDMNMPPNGGIPQEELDLFTRWALCGTPGEEVETVE